MYVNEFQGVAELSQFSVSSDENRILVGMARPHLLNNDQVCTKANFIFSTVFTEGAKAVMAAFTCCLLIQANVL